MRRLSFSATSMRINRRHAIACRQREAMMEPPCGWLFFYDSEVHCTTGNPLHMLGDNGPVLVER
jgi:hypothetical protein